MASSALAPGVGPLEVALRSARDGGRKLLVPYVTGGLGAWTDLIRALADAGASWEDVVQTNTYVTVMVECFECTGIRHEFFGPGWPTSTTLEVSRLAHPDMLVEIEAVAVAG